MPVADVYLRITADLAGQGLGVERQEADARAQITRNGWEVGVVHVDNDVSASRYGRKPRKGYAALLERIHSDSCDRVVIWDIDRLLRQPRELEDLIDLVEHRSVEVHNLHGEIDLRSSDGLFIARILVAKAAKEADDVSRRAKRKKQQLAEKGMPTGGGRRPFGWSPDRMTPEPVEAAALVDAARCLLAGDSLAGIVRRLNSVGPPPVGGNIWRTNALRSALLSPRNAGLSVHQGRVIGDATWPAILDRITWERVRAVLTDPGRLVTTTVRKHLLSGGIAVCGREGCGHRLAGKPARKGTPCYHCPGYRGGCANTYIVALPLEELVIGQVTDAVDEGRIPASAEHTDQEKWLATIGELEEDQAFLAERWARGEMGRGELGRAEWVRARDTLAGRIAEARRHLAARDISAVADYLGRPGALTAAWEHMGFDRQRAVVATYIDRVVVNPPLVRGRHSFDPDRVAIAWVA